jgi:hypothetical protein
VGSTNSTSLTVSGKNRSILALVLFFTLRIYIGSSFTTERTLSHVPRVLQGLLNAP